MQIINKIVASRTLPTQINVGWYNFNDGKLYLPINGLFLQISGGISD